MMTRSFPLTIAAVASLFAGSLAGQTQAVDIYYDPFSIPHVFGETDEAAMYGLGYQQMREYPIGTLDRLWRFTGRFSEVAGPSYLDKDYELLLWDLPALIQREKADMPADLLGLLEAFVEGIEAGRAWWRDGNTPPTTSARLKMVMGTTSDPDNVEMHVDPLPDYLNQGFHPFQYNAADPTVVHPDYDPLLVPRYITLIVDRMFEPANAITVEHVLALSIIRRTRLYRASEVRFVPIDGTVPVGVERPHVPEEAHEPAMSKGWTISTSAAGGKVVTVQDGHTGRDTLTNRPYLIQIHGDEYEATGLTHPGLPYVVIGFNDYISRCGAGASGGAVFRSVWEVELEPDAPLRFRYGANKPPAGSKTARVDGMPSGNPLARVGYHRLQSESDDLSYFDPVASKDLDMSGAIEPGEIVIGSQARERYYAPDPSALGFPNDRYPVIEVNDEKVDGLTVLPVAGDAIRFTQESFTTAGSTGEFYFRMGRVRYIDNAPGGEDQVIDVLNDDTGVYGNNLLFADRFDRFFAINPVKAAMQGPNIPERFSTDDYDRIRTGAIVLNGHLPGDRWQGFHPPNAVPQIGPLDATGPEAWIASVGTLDLVDDRLTEADLGNLHPDIIRPKSKPSWAYVRARELLMQGSIPVGGLDGMSESITTDAAEIPMLTMWDFFKKARDVKTVEEGANADVDRFIEWVDVFRHLAEDGLTCDPSLDFVAHEYSLVTPYTVLLRSWYRHELDQLAGLTELQASFGEDPVHPVHTLGPDAFVRPAYGPNIDAMWNALVGSVTSDPGVVPLWKNGTGPQGLRNKDVLVDQLTSEPWLSDPRYADTQVFVDQNLVGCGPQSFAADMDGDHVIRWGHVNMICLTPHFLEPTRASQVDADLERIRGFLYGGLRPDLISTLDTGGTNLAISRLKFPVYENQNPLAFPQRSMGEALFPVGNRVIGGSFDDYDETLYRWSGSPDDYLPFVPHEDGAQVLILARLFDPPGVEGRFLSATGATEITQPFLPHHDRFATSADFAKGIWQDLETDRGTIESTYIEHIPLTYAP